MSPSFWPDTRLSQSVCHRETHFKTFTLQWSFVVRVYKTTSNEKENTFINDIWKQFSRAYRLRHLRGIARYRKQYKVYSRHDWPALIAFTSSANLQDDLGIFENVSRQSYVVPFDLGSYIQVDVGELRVSCSQLWKILLERRVQKPQHIRRKLVCYSNGKNVL